VGVEVPPSTLPSLVQRVGKRPKPARDELLEVVKAAPVTHADETSWPVDGKNGWAWAFATDEVAVFQMEPTRSGKVPQAVLGEDVGHRAAGSADGDLRRVLHRPPAATHHAAGVEASACEHAAGMTCSARRELKNSGSSNVSEKKSGVQGGIEVRAPIGPPRPAAPPGCSTVVMVGGRLSGERGAGVAGGATGDGAPGSDLTAMHSRMTRNRACATAGTPTPTAGDPASKARKEVAPAEGGTSLLAEAGLKMGTSAPSSPAIRQHRARSCRA
jgi:hypothetical protein